VNAAPTLLAAANLAEHQATTLQAISAAFGLLSRRPGTEDAWSAAEHPSPSLTATLCARYHSPAEIAASLRHAAQAVA
jgi:hypothetical protein